MDEINKKIAVARRRLIINHFLVILAWAVFAGLVVIAVGIAIPKIWHLSSLQSPEAASFWNAAWIIGGAVSVILVAAGITIAKRQTFASVATEVDQRFNLKSRLSSTVGMSADDRQSEAGKALAADAKYQAEVIDVGDQFKIEPRRSMLLPLIPMILVGVLLTLPNAILDEPTPENAPNLTKTSEVSQVKSAVEKLKKKVKKNKLTKGLEDVDLDFDKIQKSLDESKGEKQEGARKNALVKLNNIKKQIEEQQKKLGSSKDFKDALNKLKDVGEGPAKKLADAMKQGDLDAAQKAIKQLADKLKKGELNKEEKEKLAKDMKDMAQQLQKMAAQQAEKKQQLEKQIEKAVQKGDLDKAAQLQQKLEQMQKQDPQQQQMQQMAQKLQKCAECMKQGGQQANGKKGQGQDGDPQDAEADMKDAGAQLEDLAKQMQQMQKDMEQLEDMEDLQDAIQECKDGMCPGGEGDKPGDKPGNGMGKGKGFGDRPEEKGKTGNYKSRVRAKLQKGQMVVTGKADGENVTGRTTSEAREIVEAAMTSETDPLEDQVLPKSQREHAQQYFESLREGM